MWNPFKLIFQSPKAMTDIVEGGIKALDAGFFTDEEKTEARRVMLTNLGDYMAKTTGQDTTRRMLALMVTVVFLSLAVVTAVLLIREEPNASGVLYRANLLKTFMADVMWLPFIIVVGFYFAPHLMSQIVGMRRGG